MSHWSLFRDTQASTSSSTSQSICFHSPFLIWGTHSLSPCAIQGSVGRKRIGPRLETRQSGTHISGLVCLSEIPNMTGTTGSQIWRSSGTMTFARHPNIPIQARTDTPSFQEPGSKPGPLQSCQWTCLGNGQVAYSASYYSDITLQSVKFYSSRNAPTTPCTPPTFSSRAPNVPGPKLLHLEIGILGLEAVTPIFASFLHLTLAWPLRRSFDRSLRPPLPVFPMLHIGTIRFSHLSCDAVTLVIFRLV
jgi:hypothetical protein